MSSGGGGGGGGGGPKVYKKRLPEEQGSLDISLGLINGLLDNAGYTLTPGGGRIAEIDAQIEALRNPQPGTGGTGTLADLQAQLAQAKSEGASKRTIRQIKSQISALTEGEDGEEGEGSIEQQIRALEKEKAKLIKTGEGGAGYTLAKRELTPEEQATRDFEDRLTEYSRTALEEGLRGEIPSAIREQIDTIYAEQDRQAKENLMRLGVEMAGGRGLNLTDTPIGEPLLRQYGDIQSTLGAAKASDLLKARSGEIATAQSLREFQANLSQLRNFTNPSTLLTQSSNLGLGLYTPRFRVGSAPSQGNPGATLAGVGGALGGVASLYNSGIFGGIGNLLGLGGGATNTGATLPVGAGGTGAIG